MIRRLTAVLLFAIIAICASSSPRPTPAPSQGPCSQEHEVWVSHILEKIEAIKPGMTREELLKVFRTEGGLSTGLHRTFVSRDSSYFKIDVDFEAVGRPNRDEGGRVTVVEDQRDIIVTVSRPYLQFGIAD
jgi:hypothetical protein